MFVIYLTIIMRGFHFDSGKHNVVKLTDANYNVFQTINLRIRFIMTETVKHELLTWLIFI